MKQLRAFDPSKGGSKPGYCLQNVRLGYGIPALYNDAWTAWKNTDQHTSTIPVGVAVPLYYDYTDKAGNRYGHINVRLADGRIWNDGRIFQSMTTFVSSMSNVKYVGWSTSVNKVKVITIGVDMPTAKDVTDYFKAWEKRPPTASELKDYTSKGWRYLLDKLLASQDGKRASQVKELNRVITIKNNEITRLQAELSLVGDDTKNLNKFGELLRWFVGRVGLSK